MRHPRYLYCLASWIVVVGCGALSSNPKSENQPPADKGGAAEVQPPAEKGGAAQVQAPADKGSAAQVQPPANKDTEAKFQEAVGKAVGEALKTQLSLALKDHVSTIQKNVEKSLDDKVQDAVKKTIPDIVAAIDAKWGRPPVIVTTPEVKSQPFSDKGIDAKLDQILKQLERMDGRLKALQEGMSKGAAPTCHAHSTVKTTRACPKPVPTAQCVCPNPMPVVQYVSPQPYMIPVGRRGLCQ